jgi:hypothetical protein
MTNVRLEKYPKDFEFIMNGESHQCASFFAELLSPIVGFARESDSTISSFHVDVVGFESTNFKDLFETIVHLCQGLEIEISEVQIEPLIIVFGLFGNTDICEFLMGIKSNDDPKESDVFSRIAMRKKIGLSIVNELSYLASHFDEHSEQIFECLTVSELSDILSRESLRVKDEDSLYEMISSQIKRDSSFCSLLEFIRFEFISNKVFSRFILWSTQSDFEFDWMNHRVWEHICNRLSICPQLRNQSNLHRHSNSPIDHSHDIAVNSSMKWSKDSVCIESLPFLHGIVNSLQIEHGSDWRHFLKVSSSSIYSGSYYNHDFAVSISPANGFASANIADSWLEYEFLHAKVYPTHYAIRSWFPKCSTEEWPRGWKLEGWTDTGEKVELDERREKDVIEDHLVVIFPITTRHFVRRIRLTQIGQSKRKWHSLVISCLEFYGDIIHDE